MKEGVLAVVRRMIARNTENKYIGSQLELNVTHNSAIGSADCEPVIMEVSPIDSATGLHLVSVLVIRLNLFHFM